MAYRPSDKSMPYEKPADMPMKKAKGKRNKKPMPFGKGKRGM